MPEDPNSRILDRESGVQAAEEHLAPSLDLLEEVVNYGTNLIVRCLRTSNKQIEDTIVLGVLLKQAIAMADSIALQLRGGSAITAEVQLRAMYEACLQLSWILSGESKRRAQAYFVGNLRAERAVARRQLGEQDRGRTLRGEEWDCLDPTTEELGRAREQLETIEVLLSEPALAQLNGDFDRERGRLRFDPPWYRVLGVRTVARMARDLDREIEYEGIYSPSSDVVHSSSFARHVEIREGEVSFKQIRSLEGADTLLVTTIYTLGQTYADVLAHYRPTELERYAAKFLAEWRERFFKIPRINVEPRIERIY